MKYSTLQRVLKDVNGTAFISLDVTTSVRLVGGTNNPYQGHITKHVTGMQVMVFNNPAYERIVRRRLVAEGINPDLFKVGPRPWGTRIEGTPFVEHGGAHYLEVIVLRPGNVEYRWKGLPVPEETIQGLPTPTPNDYNVVIRVFHVESIKKIRVNGKEYS